MDKPALFPVTVENRDGYIDRTGQIIIPPQYEYAFEFSEGLAEVVVGQKEGFIDISGEFVIPPQVLEVTGFSEGLAAVWGADQWGFMDKQGQVVKIGRASCRERVYVLV